MTAPCRFGILSTASIARKYWLAMKLAGNCQIAAVASRSPEKAQSFIDECQREAPFDPPPAALGSYEALLARNDIDAVYVPVPTGLRKEWVIRAAEAGKHVLAEKPAAPTSADLEQMLAACRAAGVQYMDGVMFMHSARLTAMRAALDDSTSVGRLRRISTGFSFCAPPEFFEENIRSSSHLEPLGCVGDLGWYTTRLILWAANYQLPEKVSGRLLSTVARVGEAKVPTEFSAEMFFPAGLSASMYCSFLNENQQWVYFSGDKGLLHVRDFVLPYFGSEVNFDVTQAHFHVEGCTFNMEDRTRRVAVAEYGNAATKAQETNMVRHFADLVQSGRVDESWAEIALKTQQVLDACLASAHRGGELVEVL